MRNKYAVALGKMGRGVKKTMSLAAMEQRKNAAKLSGEARAKKAAKKLARLQSA